MKGNQARKDILSFLAILILVFIIIYCIQTIKGKQVPAAPLTVFIKLFNIIYMICKISCWGRVKGRVRGAILKPPVFTGPLELLRVRFPSAALMKSKIFEVKDFRLLFLKKALMLIFIKSFCIRAFFSSLFQNLIHRENLHI